MAKNIVAAQENPVEIRTCFAVSLLAMMDDFTPLTTRDHWLGWLGDNPAQMVRDAIEESLQQQVPTAKLDGCVC